MEEEGVVDKEAFRSVGASLGVEGGKGGGGGDGGGGGGGGSMELVKVRRWRQKRRWAVLYEPWWCGWILWPNCCQGSVTPLRRGLGPFVTLAFSLPAAVALFRSPS